MGDYEMKQCTLSFFLLTILFFSCNSERNKVDDAVISYWEQHKMERKVIIDFSKNFNFNWDTLCFYSSGCSLEEINADLGFPLTQYTDLADRMVFLNHGKMVYIAGWWYSPNSSQGIRLNTPTNIFKVKRNAAKFYIMKKGNAFILKPYP